MLKKFRQNNAEEKKFPNKLANNQICSYSGKFINSNSCFSMCLNENAQLLFMGLMNKILIKALFRINNQYKNIIFLQDTSGAVTICKLMNKTNQIVTGNQYTTIKIWCKEHHQFWKLANSLEDHKSPIKCLEISQNEDFIISGSTNGEIFFWNSAMNWQCQQTIFITGMVRCLSLNDEENKLICLNEHSIIYVYQLINMKWCENQQIKLSRGYQSIFLNNSQFAFIPMIGGTMEIYDFLQKVGCFKKSKEVDLPQSQSCVPGFQAQICKSKKILLVKKGNFVNLIKQNQKQQFELCQTIRFYSSSTMGAMNQAGTYFAIRESAKGNVKVYKFKQ